MGFATTLSKLLEQDSESRVAAGDQYRQLVSDAASDRPVSAAMIEETLAAAGKSLDDLAVDVAAEQLRQSRLRTAGRRDEVLLQLQRVHVALVEEDAAFAASWKRLQEEHATRLRGLTTTERALSSEMDCITAAERRLKVCDDDRLAQITAQLQALSQREQAWSVLYGGVGRSRLSGGTAAQRERRAIDERRAALQADRCNRERELLAAN
ncbi:MAG: hypothetical protein ACYC4N_24385 [Pirellulaceae bacterium]